MSCTERLSAWRTALSPIVGLTVPSLARSPSTSVWIGELNHEALDRVPRAIDDALPPCSSSARICGSTCRFQAKSYSPVCSTARAADAASPPPFRLTVSKYGLFGSR